MRWPPWGRSVWGRQCTLNKFSLAHVLVNRILSWIRLTLLGLEEFYWNVKDALDCIGLCAGKTVTL